MARLTSEDEQIKTSFELILLKEKFESKHDISWISYKLVLQSAKQKLIYEKEKNDNGAGDYVFALKPVNEIEKMASELTSFLASEEKKLYSFEPLEPSFELIVERSHKGFSITIWVDAGNVISDHSTWDGLGMRFFTSEKNIKNFLSEVKSEIEDIKSA